MLAIPDPGAPCRVVAGRTRDEGLQRVLQRPVDLAEAGTVRDPFLLAGINHACELVYPA